MRALPSKSLRQEGTERHAHHATPRGIRPDIQGLRALAVLAVIADHLFHWPTGGFLGVDVFFVISGFLITGLLIREIDKTGRISFRNFFARRVKRILPLASVVLVTTVAASYVVFNTSRFIATATDAIWAALFGANWRFESIGTDYFLNQGPVSPLQHYWSLAVEEQFYFVWPVMIAIVVLFVRSRARRTRMIVLGAVMAALIVVSFIIATSVTASNPTSAYFSTFTRAWELGVGALLALTVGVWNKIPRRLRSPLTWLGFLGILASVFFFDTSLPFPGPWAAVPVLATALVIVAGTGAQEFSCLPLTNRVSGYLGDLSYALYLWHFPVIIIVTSLIPKTTPFSIAIILGLTALLTLASHYLVERPVRESPWLASGLTRSERASRWRAWRTEVTPMVRSVSMATLAVTTVIVVAGALVPTKAPRAALTLPDTPAQTAPANSEASYGPAVSSLQKEIKAALQATSWPDLSPSLDSVLDKSAPGSSNLKCGSSDEKGLSQDDCTWGPNSAPKTAVLVGDSTSLHYLDAFVEMAESQGSQWKVANRAMFACPFIDVRIQNDTSNILENCKKHNESTIDYLAQQKPDLVIVTNSYQVLTNAATGHPVTAQEWGEGVSKYMTRIKDAAKAVSVLTPPPDQADIKACYSKTSTPADCVTRTQSTWTTRADAEKNSVESSGGLFFDARPLTTFETLTPAFVGTTPMKEDATHLTSAYQKKLVPAMTEMFNAKKFF